MEEQKVQVGIQSRFNQAFGGLGQVLMCVAFMQYEL